MASDNVTPIGSDSEPRGPPPPTVPGDAFDDLYGRMQDELSALLCVLTTLECGDGDPERSAAVGLLRQTYKALDELHDDFATWQMKRDGGGES